jgi:putative tryptophan/tyrosine transport system substrate-binding protein
VKRREFITLLGGASVAWPLAARAQQPAMPMIGVLISGVSPETALSAFRKGLGEGGYFEGRSVAFEIRHTDQNDRLPALAAELVEHPVTLIFATGNANAARAAKAATTAIPVVFSNGGDPVMLGLVASMSRPGGNVTGVSYYAAALATKRLGLLRELLPQIDKIGFLTNPTNLVSDTTTRDVRAAAESIGQQIVTLKASTPHELDTAFALASEQRIGALVVDVDAFFAGRNAQIVALAARYRIPASYANRAFVAAGGLMSYADDRLDSRRQAGIYAARILKGEKPADLPVLQPTKFELVINLKTGKSLGLDVPPMLPALADEVIE